jgi:hypothetical protein
MLQFHDEENKRSAVGIWCGNMMKIIHPEEDLWVDSQ